MLIATNATSWIQNIHMKHLEHPESKYNGLLYDVTGQVFST
jgi:hypothetical protein